MVLIIGGAFQGKRSYALAQYPGIPFPPAKDLSLQDFRQLKGACNLEEYIELSLKKGEDLSCLGEDLIRLNPDLILTMREVGSGIVPIDPFERRYRETVGRVGIVLASFANKVVRVSCGLPMILKETK